jgi:folylpolyglutamate synthase
VYITRWDCIRINNKLVNEAKFKKVEEHFKSLNQRENIQASEFELLTATAFQLFNDHNVQYGIVEVGMGGRLDSTNILNNQVVSVIAKIAHDHQNLLGNTLEEIARHKAGILRPNVPYIVNPRNEWHVQEVIDEIAKEIGAGPRIDGANVLKKELPGPEDMRDWEKFAANLPGFQVDNALLAFCAVKQALGGGVGLRKSLIALQNLQSHLPGRCESIAVPDVFGSEDRKMLIDGAHNPDAAQALERWVSGSVRFTTVEQQKTAKAMPPSGWPVTWVIAMTDGKDPREFLRRLVRSGDNFVFTTFGAVEGMPWVEPMDPHDLCEIAEEMFPENIGIVVPERNTHRALMAAKHLAGNGLPIVLTGSLYLVGSFLRELTTPEFKRSNFEKMDWQEKNRVNKTLNLLADDLYINGRRLKIRRNELRKKEETEEEKGKSDTAAENITEEAESSGEINRPRHEDIAKATAHQIRRKDQAVRPTGSFPK